MVSKAFSNYFTQPLHSDKELGEIKIEKEKEIRELLNYHEKNINICLNYLKTLIFTGGYVSKEQDMAFKEILNNLNEINVKKLQDILGNILSKHKLEIKIVDIKSYEYFLKIEPFTNGAR